MCLNPRGAAAVHPIGKMPRCRTKRGTALPRTAICGSSRSLSCPPAHGALSDGTVHAR